MYARTAARHRAHDSNFGGQSLTHSVPAKIAVVIEGVSLKGHIVSNQDMIVEGEVEGTIDMRDHSLIVASTGSVRGDVNAREVVVVGSIYGDVEAVDRICICREASMIGNIRTAAIEIEDGGFIQGGIACCKIGEVLGVKGSSRTRFLYDAPETLEFSPVVP
jgi:cytoskeletal protein CcmA (bactofilin family)